MSSNQTSNSNNGIRWFFKNPVTWVLLAPMIIVLMVALVMQARGSSPKLPVHGDAPAFNLEDQRAQPFSSERLRGNVWIANFIFTRCQTVCPLNTAKMADVQRRLGSNADVQLVSFSVDPQHDTPERLRAYARRFNADQTTWSLVRGPRRDMKRVVNQGFKVAMGIIGIEDDSETDTTNVDQADMVHGEHFILVDTHLRIRGYYKLDTDADFKELVRHAKALAN